MPVSADVQMTISQRYIALTDSITHGNEVAERAMLAPHFTDHAKLKLLQYEYDPLTVLVQKITSNGNQLIVHAQYVGIGKHRENAIDRWTLVNGEWKLAQRSKGD
jgi:hypothetical protein